MYTYIKKIALFVTFCFTLPLAANAQGLEDVQIEPGPTYKKVCGKNLQGKKACMMMEISSSYGNQHQHQKQGLSTGEALLLGGVAALVGREIIKRRGRHGHRGGYGHRGYGGHGYYQSNQGWYHCHRNGACDSRIH